MSYDSDSSQHTEPVNFTPQSLPTVNPRDLETIVTLLELAALELTPEPGATFTRAQLVNLAKEIGGPEIPLDENDVNLVLRKNGFLKKSGDKYRLK